MSRSTSPVRLRRRRGARAAGEITVVDRRPSGPLSPPPPDPPQDRATYGCTCGFVFDATVSTSVACPHCGAAQAW